MNEGGRLAENEDIYERRHSRPERGDIINQNENIGLVGQLMTINRLTWIFLGVVIDKRGFACGAGLEASPCHYFISPCL